MHIAVTPEEHMRLKKNLPKIEPDDNFDCYLHGSVDHVRMSFHAIGRLVDTLSWTLLKRSMPITNIDGQPCERHTAMCLTSSRTFVQS